MTDTNLKEKSVDELLVILGTAQRNLALSKIYKQGADLIQQNKNQLAKVQKAIVEKRGDPFPTMKIIS